MLLSKINMLTILKGSCGKSTSVCNIAACISSYLDPPKKVLVIDLDPQADLIKMFGLQNNKKNIYEVMLGNANLEPVKIRENLHVVPSTEDLYYYSNSGSDNKYRLKEILEAAKSDYDFIFIDCHADMSLLNINAFSASDRIFIPVKADYLSVSNVPNTIKAMNRTKKSLNPNIELGGIFMTFFDERITLHKNARSTLGEMYRSKLLKSSIRNNVRVAEAPGQELDIFSLDPNSNGARDYYNLSLELLGIN